MPDETVDSYERAISGIDLAQPGVKESIARLRKSVISEPTKTQAIIKRFTLTSKRFIDAIQLDRLRNFENIERARKTISDISTADAVFDGVRKVPYVGEIIYGVYQVARPFAVAKAEADSRGESLFSSNWKPGGTPLFTGWTADPINQDQGDYFLQDVPVLSFASPIMVYPFILYSDGYTPSMQCLLRLTDVFPYGPPVSNVLIRDSGQFSYKFNPWQPGNISDEESAAQHVFWLDVWNPLDISPTGPRGFDRNNPRAWRESAAAEALSKGWLDPKRSPYYPENQPSPASPATGPAAGL